MQLAEIGVVREGGLFADGTGTRVRDALVTTKAGDLYLSWAFIVDGKVIADDRELKLRGLWNALAERRNAGGLVLVVARVSAETTLEQARSRYGDLAAGALGRAAGLLTPRSQV